MGGDSVVQGLSGALLVGLAGFLYLHASYFQRFRLAPASPQTRTSLAFAYGLAFLFSAGLLAKADIGWMLPIKSHLSSIWNAVSPIKSLPGVFGAAPVVGLIAGVGSNFWRLIRASDRFYLKDSRHILHSSNISQRMRLAAFGDLAAKTDDQLLWTMWRAITLGKLVQVTLKNRKVYVGSPLPISDPSAASLWLKIVPIASGFRDSDTLAYVPTTDYRPLFQALADAPKGSGPESKSILKVSGVESGIEFDQHDLGFLLPWSEVASISIHDPALEAYFAPAVESEVEAGDGNDEDGSPTNQPSPAGE